MQNTLRRIAAIVATGFGIATQAVPTMHLPLVVSAILTACSPLIELMEHYAAVTPAPAPAVAVHSASTSLVPGN